MARAFGRWLGIVELKKQISCSLQLSNKTEDYVAFKVTRISLTSSHFLWF